MNTETLLKYGSSAKCFDEAIPVGNGRIGGMIFGIPDSEKIILNEDSVWSGGLRHRINPDSQEGLKEVRSLIAEGDISGAEKTAAEKMYGVTPDMRHYMPLGQLSLDMDIVGRAKNYTRSLQLSTAVSDVHFTVNDVEFTREVFVSAPEQAMIIHITSSQSGAVNFTCGIGGRDGFFDDNRPCEKNMLLYTGGTGSKDGIFFAVTAGAVCEGGEVRTVGGNISVRNADEATIIITARTSFYSDNYIEMAKSDCRAALSFSYDELYRRHVYDYKELFDRVEFSLNDNSDAGDEITTDRRIARLRGNELDDKECERNIHDNKLIELYFNFGRYLMISSSRKGTQPINMQGIWNEDMSPVGGSRFRTDINTQMSYWCAESCNLSECHLPLFDLLERVCENGKTTAKEMYGVKKGFVCHTATDIWGDTAPQDSSPSSTIWLMGGAWLSLHVYEHYEYTLDREFLDKNYHIMKEAAEFLVEYLTENENGQLVICPSLSPENTYITENGCKGSLCMGSAIDSQITTVLFRAVINSAEILGRDKTFAKKLKSMLKKLPEPVIGRYGQIQEWNMDYNEAEIGHKHVSQLFALCPANLISPEKTPKLADAARATLIRRLIHGKGNEGWSCAWVTDMWASLHDNRMVYENLKKLLARCTGANMITSAPHFSVDGNLGGTSAIADALMQSDGNEINILPALPDVWTDGHIHGLRAKGGFGVDIDWSDGKLSSAVITSDAGGECRVRVNSVVSVTCSGKSVCSIIDNGVIIFNTEAGHKYLLK